MFLVLYLRQKCDQTLPLRRKQIEAGDLVVGDIIRAFCFCLNRKCQISQINVASNLKKLRIINGFKPFPMAVGHWTNIFYFFNTDMKAGDKIPADIRLVACSADTLVRGGWG